MSEFEYVEAAGPWWSPLLGVLLIALFVLAVWVLLHAPEIYRRGRDYRRRLRAARHRRSSLHHLRFERPIR